MCKRQAPSGFSGTGGSQILHVILSVTRLVVKSNGPRSPPPTATKVTFTLSLPQSLLGVGGGAGTGIKDRGIIPLMETL